MENKTVTDREPEQKQYKSGLEALANATEERGKEIGKTAINLGQILCHDKSLHFFITTIDLSNGLCYAPITNIPYDLLDKITRKSTNPSTDNIDVTEAIRNLFPIGYGESDFLSTLCKGLREHSESKYLYILGIDNTGKVEEQRKIDYSEPKKSKPFEAQIKEIINKHDTIGKEAQRRIAYLRNEISNKEIELKTYLIIRTGERFQDIIDARTIDFIRVGIVFSETPIDEKILKIVIPATDISSFAALTLLYEKERYYQKALRQAVRGSIIKYGIKEDIDDQVTILKALRKYNQHTVPLVQHYELLPKDKKRKDISKYDDFFAWYRMARFELPSMFDLLTTTVGFEDYEVKTITRSCFRHLRDTYWVKKVNGVEPKINESNPVLSISVYLVNTLNQIEYTYNTIRERWGNISRGRATRVGRDIDVFDSKPFERYSDLIDTMKPEFIDDFSIGIKWGENSDSHMIKNAFQRIKDIYKVLIDNSHDYNDDKLSRILISDKGNNDNAILHGDAHFGNFLVDASIPEDTFVISIDPRKLKFTLDDKKKISKHISENVKNIYSTTAVNSEVEHIIMDPLFDVAKLMLSTSCVYGLIYRNAFEFKKEDCKYKLRWDGNEMPIKQQETGGISGAQIVSLHAPVTERAWEYHNIAGKELLNVYLKWQREILGNHGNVHSYELFSLVRLWLLTIRHAFSISEKLFPVELDKAMAMYIMVSGFVDRGGEEIKRIIENRFKAIDEKDVRSTASKLFNLPFE